MSIVLDKVGCKLINKLFVAVGIAYKNWHLYSRFAANRRIIRAVCSQIRHFLLSSVPCQEYTSPGTPLQAALPDDYYQMLIKWQPMDSLLC
jgi:hypothetical protein